MRRNLGIFPSFFYPSHFSFKTAMACSPKEQTAETPQPLLPCGPWPPFISDEQSGPRFC